MFLFCERWNETGFGSKTVVPRDGGDKGFLGFCEVELRCKKVSTGIPHILEHNVLYGSRKYPLKEPFIELLKGSLHTSLNAFTYPDTMCILLHLQTQRFHNCNIHSVIVSKVIKRR